MNERQKIALRAVKDGAPADGRTVAALQRRGWVDESGRVTHEGWEEYLDSVETSTLTLLTLGTPLYRVPTTQRGVYASFPKGTRLTVVFGGREGKRQQRWYDCYADTRFGVIRVYQNNAHKIETVRVPKEEIHEETIAV